MMKIRITLKRSLIGRTEKVRKVVSALGLRKINHSVEHNDTPSVRGMIYRVSTMVEVEEIKEKAVKKTRDAPEKVDKPEKQI
ncbi:MAG TPA: 50S ribosomal protein L30 [Nitrospirae bacterium]|nr:50S ribosomal protein L30 [Nitrospirota bacterium]